MTNINQIYENAIEIDGECIMIKYPDNINGYCVIFGNRYIIGKENANSYVIIDEYKLEDYGLKMKLVSNLTGKEQEVNSSQSIFTQIMYKFKETTDYSKRILNICRLLENVDIDKIIEITSRDKGKEAENEVNSFLKDNNIKYEIIEELRGNKGNNKKRPDRTIKLNDIRFSLEIKALEETTREIKLLNDYISGINIVHGGNIFSDDLAVKRITSQIQKSIKQHDDYNISVMKIPVENRITVFVDKREYYAINFDLETIIPALYHATNENTQTHWINDELLSVLPKIGYIGELKDNKLILYKNPHVNSDRTNIDGYDNIEIIEFPN